MTTSPQATDAGEPVTVGEIYGLKLRPQARRSQLHLRKESLQRQKEAG